MFERFSSRARQVVVLAQEEARTLGHNYIGTEHILLGLLREQEGLAARMLRELGVTLEAARAGVVLMAGSGEEEQRSQIPFTPRAKKVLELSLRESLELGHNYIGTEHILLALTREPEGVGARVLREMDADGERVRSETIRFLSGPAPLPQHVPAGTGWAGVEGLAPFMGQLAVEIRRELHREPDSGDVLLVMVCTRETLAGRALGELDLDLDALRTTIERLRHQQPRTQQKPGPEVLKEIRRRLGLPGAGSGESPL